MYKLIAIKIIAEYNRNIRNPKSAVDVRGGLNSKAILIPCSQWIKRNLDLDFIIIVIYKRFPGNRGHERRDTLLTVD